MISSLLRLVTVQRRGIREGDFGDNYAFRFKETDTFGLSGARRLHGIYLRLQLPLSILPQSVIGDRQRR